MRMFTKVNKEGTIISFSKVKSLPEGIDQPFADLAQDESVVEVEPTKDLEKLPAHKIHENYRVNMKSKKLMKKKPERK